MIWWNLLCFQSAVWKVSGGVLTTCSLSGRVSTEVQKIQAEIQINKCWCFTDQSWIIQMTGQRLNNNISWIKPHIILNKCVCEHAWSVKQKRLRGLGVIWNFWGQGSYGSPAVKVRGFMGCLGSNCVMKAVMSKWVIKLQETSENNQTKTKWWGISNESTKYWVCIDNSLIK